MKDRPTRKGSRTSVLQWVILWETLCDNKRQEVVGRSVAERNFNYFSGNILHG